MNLADALKSLKELFLEFLGYFLPGFSLLFILGVVLNEEVLESIFQKRVLLVTDNTYILIFIAYLLGYIVYGADLSRKTLLSFISGKAPRLSHRIKKTFYIRTRRDIEATISSSFEYKATKAIINHKFGSEEIDLGFSGYRNYAMSTISSDDVQKIYTFIFRGELSKHIGLIFFTVGLICILLATFDVQLVKSTFLYFSLYIGLIFSGYFLQKTAERFTLIGLKIGFSIFISDQYLKK